MFENFGTALVQAIGFFGVFIFFVYQLISEKKAKPTNVSIKKDISQSSVNLKPKNNFFFARNKNTQANSDLESKSKKKGWFNR
tara:strand:- start:1693 stop:1941 length:249 start_codon:yes stop_codon:yes gene_type:complete